jgi:hypothetical protein
MKKELPGKIYWNGYRQQIKELYWLLYCEKYISCDADEFISHFTGKKWRKVIKNSGRKLTWEKEKYLLILLIHHLIEKRFIDSTLKEDYINTLKKHFNDVPDAAGRLYIKYKNEPIAKRLQKQLDSLFPVNTGFRCKERTYYKLRNKEHEFAILKN